MGVTLSNEQLDAVSKLRNGSILCGDVGAGKSRTALAYYFFEVCKGDIVLNGHGGYSPMIEPRDLYIITTAKKRDSLEWEAECSSFMLTSDPDSSPSGVSVTVDSWNNIKKYKKVCGAFFIFDEQRVSGSGAWVKAFLDISRKNKWILLSATPGDTWCDYIPVFIANGFYKNKTEFNRLHCEFAPYVTYPVITGYKYENVLQERLDQILAKLGDRRETKRHWIDIKVGYDKKLLKTVMKDRWDPYDDKPIENVGKLYYLLRKVVNSSEERLNVVKDILDELPFGSETEWKKNGEPDHHRFIIFYNFTYELGLLRCLCSELDMPCAEWNGEKHDPIPTGKRWVYLVQYNAGSEGWNCIDTNVVIFFSQNYSYRMTEQAAGRIDRMNTPFKDLYYYRLFSSAWIDLAIRSALKQKKDFNERTHERMLEKKCEEL